MSLTEFVKTKEIQDEMRKRLPFEPFKIKGEIKAAPQTDNHSLVGTAFDYLLRFFIEQNSKKNSSHIITKKWVAQSARDRMVISDMDGLGMYTPTRNRMNISFHKMTKRVTRLVDNAKENHRTYLKNGKITDSLLKTCIHLAQIDPYLRRLVITGNMGSVEKKDVTDLRNLLSLATRKRFTAKKYACLNPTFGYGTRLVGSADADLIIDGMLVDIKTTKYPTFKREYYNQLVGYYILSLLGQVRMNRSNWKSATVSHIGVYFSRYGVLHTFPTKPLVEDSGFHNLVKMFERKATEWYLTHDRADLPWESK